MVTESFRIVHEKGRLVIARNRAYYLAQYRYTIITGVILLLLSPLLLVLLKWPLWLIVLLAVPVLGVMLNCAVLLRRGQVNEPDIIIDRDRREVIVDKNPSQSYSMMQAVESKQSTERYGHTFTIYLILSDNQEPVKIEAGLTYAKAEQLASELAKYVGVEIVRT